MSSETYFLQPIDSTSDPINAEAIGSAQFFNYSQAADNSSNSADFQVLVQGGVAFAIANADSIFINNPGFTDLFTEAFAEGIGGSFEAESLTSTEVIATFAIEEDKTFSFDFIADISLESTEIDNPDIAYTEAQSRIGFLVLDTSDVDQPKILDFAGVSGELISSKQKGRVVPLIGRRQNITINSTDTNKDIDGNNGEDFINFFASGRYERTLNQETQITIVEINRSFVQLQGDFLIDHLGDDVQYGTVGADRLNGTNNADKIYGSLNNDNIDGKSGDDILEGGADNDQINGGWGNDKIHGGSGEDTLTGGRGSDTLVGGDDADRFVFQRNQSLRNGELDMIVDFEVGVDKIEIKNWGNGNNWLSQAIANGDFINSSDGALYTLNRGGQVLFEGVNLNSLSDSDFIFT
ncbi:MAG: calcium-binding protein [Microcoleaceae cyanobacterium]